MADAAGRRALWPLRIYLGAFVGGWLLSTFGYPAHAWFGGRDLRAPELAVLGFALLMMVIQTALAFRLGRRGFGRGWRLLGLLHGLAPLGLLAVLVLTHLSGLPSWRVTDLGGWAKTARTILWGVDWLEQLTYVTLLATLWPHRARSGFVTGCLAIGWICLTLTVVAMVGESLLAPGLVPGTFGRAAPKLLDCLLVLAMGRLAVRMSATPPTHRPAWPGWAGRMQRLEVALGVLAGVAVLGVFVARGAGAVIWPALLGAACLGVGAGLLGLRRAADVWTRAVACVGAVCMLAAGGLFLARTGQGAPGDLTAYALAAGGLGLMSTIEALRRAAAVFGDVATVRRLMLAQVTLLVFAAIALAPFRLARAVGQATTGTVGVLCFVTVVVYLFSAAEDLATAPSAATPNVD